jgi:hypothetical protein
MPNEIDITVKVKDQTKSGMDSIQQNSKKTGSTLQTVGKMAAGFIAAHVVAAGAARVKEFVSGSVTAFSNLNESLNAVNKIFGKSQDKILAWGKSTANSYGLSQRAFNDLAVPLGAGLKNAGIPLGKVADLTIDLTKRASDMASVFNTSVPDALEAVQAGLRGEADPLERYGVGLSAARVQAEALSETHKKSAKSLTSQELALARVNLIMKQTESTAGDFVSTSGQLANAQRIASAKSEELQAKIGQQLAPAVLMLTQAKVKLTAVVAEKLLPALIKFGSWIKEHATVVQVAAAVIGGVLVAAFVAWAVAAGAAAIATLVAMAPIIAIGAAIGLLVLGFMKAREHSEIFRNALHDVGQVAKIVFHAITSAVSATLGWIKAHWPLLVSILTGPIGAAVVYITRHWSQIRAGVSNVLSWIRSNWRTILSILTGPVGAAVIYVSSHFGQIRTAASRAVSGVRGAFSSVYGAITNPIRNAINAARSWLSGLLSYVRSIPSQIGGSIRGALGFAHGGVIGSAASGGPRSGLTMVGEHGRELVKLAPGSQVYPNGATEAMMSGGGGGMVLIEIRSGGSKLDDLLVEILRKSVRTRGGNVQLVLGRS